MEPPSVASLGSSGSNPRDPSGAPHEQGVVKPRGTAGFERGVGAGVGTPVGLALNLGALGHTSSRLLGFRGSPVQRRNRGSPGWTPPIRFCA